jgi:ABC-type spermidine/putrescine transport system permease subunit II
VSEIGGMSRWMHAALWLMLFILFAPLLVIIALSFNESQFGTLPFHFTLKWYRALFSSSNLLSPTGLSVRVSIEVAATSVVTGTMAAVWLTRRANRVGAALLNTVMLSALTVPWLVLGVAMLLVANAIGLGRSMFSIYLGLTAITLPYVTFLVVNRLRGIDPNLEHAARSLGAGPVRTYLRVVLPLALPAIAGGGLIAFMVAFNNFLIQFFLAPFGVQTLPLEIYTLIRVGYQPDLNALATLIVVATVTLALLLNRFGVDQRRLVGTRAG